MIWACGANESSDRSMRRIHDANVDGKRILEHPRKTWHDEVDKILECQVRKIGEDVYYII